ncbi:unnamed protein product [marine sediment metagenome]|uniref:Uncharacterized protein n=1 Tax=marine sediment metagenome TaxID=412755 RepID=X1TR18_9ZZZZ
MNQLIVTQQIVPQQVQPQEQIQALMVQAQWFSSVLTGLAIAGGVLFLLPKIIKVVKEK